MANRNSTVRNKNAVDEPGNSKPKFHLVVWLAMLVVVVIGATYSVHAINTSNKQPSTVPTVQETKPAAVQPKPSNVTNTATATNPSTPADNMCASNNLSQFILVSISQRHMWACEQTKQVYDSAVVTGMENLAADLTPTGTYHIYAKETNLYLKGHDSTGSWDDYVNYWMPFLDNQYGEYGFHDATWRADNAFGNISPYSSDASHGCVELPLATAKWLFDWAQVGTTLTIES